MQKDESYLLQKYWKILKLIRKITIHKKNTVMSQKNINNISEVQAQFDGKKYYMPSFYRINLGVLADFMDVPNIPFGSYSAFFHEYIHYLQDVTTMYGMMVLGTTTYYIRDVASRFSMKNCTFDVPQHLTQGRSDYGLLNANLRNIYKGSSINPMRKDVDILEYKIENVQLDSKEIERVLVTCIDNTTGESFTFYLGGNILCEGMAYMVQRKCYDDVYIQNGVSPLKLSDYPYLINFDLASLIYPEISDQWELLVGIADISLLTYNAGLTYVRLLEHLRDSHFFERYNKTNMYSIFDDLYNEGHKFINWHLSRFKKVQDYSYNEMREYFKMPIATEINDWISRIWAKAYELREKAPHYIIDLMLANEGDVRSNKIFCEILLGMGTPLVINGDDEGTVIPPQGFTPSPDFMPGLMWAVDEIGRIFDGRPEAVPCQLYDYCKKSAVSHTSQNPHLSRTKVDDRCLTSPWSRSQDDNALCPVAAIWKHWGLKNCQPKWK